MKTLFSRLATLFSPERMIDWIGALIPNLIAAASMMLAFYVAWRVLENMLVRALRRSGADATASSFIQTLLKAALMTLAVGSALTQLGIDTRSILASLGVAGLTLGFAAKDTLSNVISGIFIFWDRPFVIGDLVEIEGRYGRVDKITLRSTRVVTVDGKMLAIPNTIIANTTVTSYTNFPHLRLDIPLTVGLEEDYGRVAELMIAVARDHAEFMPEPAPRVVIKTVNDYNVEVELQVWIRDEKQHVAVRFELRRRLYEALRSAKVVMPFETLQLAPIELTRVESTPRAPGERTG